MRTWRIEVCCFVTRNKSQRCRSALLWWCCQLSRWPDDCRRDAGNEPCWNDPPAFVQTMGCWCGCSRPITLQLSLIKEQHNNASLLWWKQILSANVQTQAVTNLDGLVIGATHNAGVIELHTWHACQQKPSANRPQSGSTLTSRRMYATAGTCTLFFSHVRGKLMLHVTYSVATLCMSVKCAHCASTLHPVIVQPIALGEDLFPLDPQTITSIGSNVIFESLVSRTYSNTGVTI